MIRRPTASDIPEIARIHVQAWAETYAGLLPEDELLSRDVPFRLSQWEAQITEQVGTIAYAPGAGFAQVGPQRDKALAMRGYPYELYTLYLLKSAQGMGLGRKLFAAVRPDGPFTALVLESNARANLFYERQGGVLVETRPEMVGKAPITERVYAWPGPLNLYP